MTNSNIETLTYLIALNVLPYVSCTIEKTLNIEDIYHTEMKKVLDLDKVVNLNTIQSMVWLFISPACQPQFVYVGTMLGTSFMYVFDFLGFCHHPNAVGI